jgi:hypothetical protein
VGLLTEEQGVTRKRPTFVHQETVLVERAEIEEDMVKFEGMIETEGFRKLTKEAEAGGGEKETGGIGSGFDEKKGADPSTRTWISESRFPQS